MQQRGLLQQALQGRLLDQRHVTIEDQHLVGLEERQRLGHRMAGAELFGLQHEVEVVRLQTLANPLRAMSDHHVNALGMQLARSIDHMGQHRFAGDGMKNLRQRRTHARALTGSEDDDFKGHGKRTVPGMYGKTREMEKKKGSQGYPFSICR
ncbi:hypothetical protein D3C80_1610810 [compost metagenome]